jgi:hypothetical protein
MSRLQRLALAFAVVVLGAIVLSPRSHAGLAQQQRDQIAINVIVNVTPAAGFVPPPAQQVPIAARLHLRESRGSDQNVDAFVSQSGELVAAAQKSLKVTAQVTPNPNATLLYGNIPGVQMTGTAGTTIQQSCIYTVTVHTTITTWTLREGLSGNFAAGFPGTDLANNSYIQGATPQPTSTPFIVYPTSWSILGQSGGIKTYCVDLSLTIPATVPGGTYSTNAVYTLYY